MQTEILPTRERSAKKSKCIIKIDSVLDLHSLYADLDPGFETNADPDPIPNPYPDPGLKL
jgi:hypothetical protein